MYSGGKKSYIYLLGDWREAISISRFLLVLLISLISIPLAASEKILAADTSLYINSVESDQEEARLLGVDLGFKLEHLIDQELTLKLDGGFFFESGSYQSVLSLDEHAPNSAIRVSEAGVIWTPFTVTEFKAGLLNQGWMESPLLLGDVAFPSASEKLFLYQGEKHFNLFMVYTQSIPNNRNLSRRMGEISEGTPSLITESIGFTIWNDSMEFDSTFTHFNFSNLSHGTAAKSQFLGNSVYGLVDSTDYLYSYKGYNWSGELTHPLWGNWKAGWKGEYLYNYQAPDGRNSGYLATITARNEKVQIKAGHFYNESDSSPAYYNSGEFGHNNMKGVLAGLSFYNLKNSVDLHMNCYLRREIEDSPYQSSGEMITLTLVRHYDF